MRTIIFGDIHGCGAPLLTLLEQINPDPAADSIIFLGDLVDRGPDSWLVWQRVAALKRVYGDRLILLRGNHESYWLEKQPSLFARRLHAQVGRNATVESFRKNNTPVETFQRWLAENTVVFYKAEGFQCAHAGILVDPMEANDSYTLIHDHAVVPQNRYSGPLTITGHIGLETACYFAGDGETVEPLETGKRYPLPKSGVLCIDTGCGKGGKLTAMVIEGLFFTLTEAAESMRTNQ